MRAALGVPRDCPPLVRQGSQYWIAQTPNRLLDRSLRVAIHAIGNAGQASASAAATWMRNEFHPATLILAGIAAGRRGLVKIGDVVLARAVVDYTHEVATKGRRLPRPTISPMPHPMRQMLAGFDFDPGHYHRAVLKLFGGAPSLPFDASASFQSDFTKHVRLDPAVTDAEIASADLLLRDKEVLERLGEQLHQGIRIGEMEAGGFVEACSRDVIPTCWLVARGISDFGDDFKSDDFHRWASCAVAAWVRHFLEDGFNLATALPSRGPDPHHEVAAADRCAELKGKLRHAQDLDARDQNREALSLLEEVYHSARAHGLREQELEAALNLGFIRSARRDAGAITKWLKIAKSLLRDVNSPWHRAQYYRLKSRALRHKGNKKQSEQALLSALELVDDPDIDDKTVEVGLLARADHVHLLCNANRTDEASIHLPMLTKVLGEPGERHPIGLIAVALEACVHWAASRADAAEVKRLVESALERGVDREAAICLAHALQDCANGARGAKATEIAVICGDAAEILGRVAQRPDMALAAAYTAAGALAESGDYRAAQERCVRLIDVANSLEEPVLRFSLFQLLSQTSRHLGDKTTAVQMAKAALLDAGGDATALCAANLALAEALRDCGRAKEALQHARVAVELCSSNDVCSEWREQGWVLTGDCAGRIGDWTTAENAIVQLRSAPARSAGTASRRKMLESRMRMHRAFHEAVSSVLTARKPLEVAGIRNVDSAQAANKMLVKDLIVGWLAYPNAAERLYDYWGRGNLLRAMLCLQAFPSSFNVTIEVHNVEEARLAVRLWGLMADVVVMIWKGPTVSSGVVIPLPGTMLDAGGGGYLATSMAESPAEISSAFKLGESRVELPLSGPTPAVMTRHASLLPPEMGRFLSQEAMALVAAGRLLVVPGTGICSVGSGYGPVEGLFAKACQAMPAIRGDATGLPPMWLPFFPDIPLEALAEVVQEQDSPLRRLRLALFRKARQLRNTGVSGTSVAEAKEVELEMQDAIAHAGDAQAELRRKHGWGETSEAVATRCDGFTEDEIAPILVLQKMGYRWRVESTTPDDESSAERAAFPADDEPVGTWLCPPSTRPGRLSEDQLREIRRNRRRRSKRS